MLCILCDDDLLNPTINGHLLCYQIFTIMVIVSVHIFTAMMVSLLWKRVLRVGLLVEEYVD